MKEAQTRHAPDESGSWTYRVLGGCLIAAVAIGSAASFCVFLVLAVGYVTPATRVANLDELPSISRITDSKAAVQCVYVKIRSPHSERVCVIGQVANEGELMRLFPFLGDAESCPGADSIRGLIPEGLIDAIGDSEPFGPSDRFWLVSVPGRNGRKGTDASVGFSQSSNRFYLEYAWHF